MKRFSALLALTITALALGAANASATNPTLIAPAAGAHTGANGQINLHYTLPDAPSYDVAVTFTREAPGFPATSLLINSHDLEQNITFNAASPASTAPIYSASGPITDGVYEVTVGYFSDVQGGYVTTTHYNVRVDSTTAAPTLISPTTAETVSQIPVSFYLPEALTPGSAHLVFSGSGSCDLTLADPAQYATTTFTLNPASPASATEVASVANGCSLPDGTYSVALSYKDVYGNPAATTISSNVTIDTVTGAPTLIAPASSDLFPARLAVDYELPEIATAGSVTLTFVGAVTRTITLAGETVGDHGFTFDPADPSSEDEVVSIGGGDEIPQGLYSVTLSYQDHVGNSASSAAAATNVRVGAVPKPAGLAASSITQTSATLSWTAAPADAGVVEYVIFKNGASVGTSENASAPITLTCGTRANFTVAARDAAGNDSVPSDVKSVTGADCDDTQAPQKPTGLVASAVTQSSATLSWSATTDNVGVATYRVFKDGVQITSTASLSTPVTLVCGTTSHFAVAADDAAGNESAQSATLDITGAACDVPPPPAPSAPTTPSTKKCLAPIQPKSISGTYKQGKKKVKFSLKISGKVSADGQSIKISGAKKNVQFYFKADGKTSTGSSITVANPSLVLVIYKPKVGSNKTIKIQLKQGSC